MIRIALLALFASATAIAIGGFGATCEAAEAPHGGHVRHKTVYRAHPHAYHYRRPPVPHYQKHAPHWKFYGYYPKYEAGFHVRQLQSVGYPGGGVWWRGRAW